MQVKLFFVIFNLNYELHTVSVRKPYEQMSSLWTVRFLKIVMRLLFSARAELLVHTPLPATGGRYKINSILAFKLLEQHNKHKKSNPLLMTIRMLLGCSMLKMYWYL